MIGCPFSGRQGGCSVRRTPFFLHVNTLDDHITHASRERSHPELLQKHLDADEKKSSATAVSSELMHIPSLHSHRYCAGVKRLERASERRATRAGQERVTGTRGGVTSVATFVYAGNSSCCPDLCPHVSCLAVCQQEWRRSCCSLPAGQGNLTAPAASPYARST